MSRSYLWLALYKNVLSKQSPFPPMKLFKTSHIFMYNKAKGGLDKATELEHRVRCTIKASFEVKYIFRMLVACLVNAWRVSQAISLNQKISVPASLQSIRMWLRKEITIQDFSHHVAIDILKAVKIESIALAKAYVAIPAQVQVAETVSIEEQLCNYISTTSFPQRNRVKAWNDGMLAQLRRFKSATLNHDDAVHGRTRKSCVLCMNGPSAKRETDFHCSTCKVSLCMRPLRTTQKSCFTQWHKRKDIEKESRKRKRINSEQYATKTYEDETNNEEYEEEHKNNA